MRADEVSEVAWRRPFAPFRVTLTTGETFDVRHPELIMVGHRSAVIGIPREPNGTTYHRTIHVDLAHVVSIEVLTAAPPASNGPSA